MEFQLLLVDGIGRSSTEVPGANDEVLSYLAFFLAPVK